MAYETTTNWKNELEDEYQKLKEGIIEHIEDAFRPEDSKIHLRKLKENFYDDIKSVRQLDAVNSVAGLIRLLEKRLLLGWFKVDPFKTILSEYDMDGDSTDRYLEYLTVFEKYRLRNKKVFSTYPYDVDILREVPQNSEVIPRHISEFICQEMKSKWLEFGKELVSEGLACEGQLDKLIESDIPTDEKTQKLLDFFVKGDKRNKRSHLCELLMIVNNKLGGEVRDKFIEANPED